MIRTRIGVTSMKSQRKVKDRSLDPQIAASVRSAAAYLDGGGDIEARDRDGRTLLVNAAADDRPNVVQLLLDRGADVNSQDKNGHAALHFAAMNYCADVARRLLASGARVDIQDSDGNTPLSNAVFYSEGKGAMIRLLLNAGADRNLSNKHGQSPLGLAESIANYDNLKHFG